MVTGEPERLLGAGPLQAVSGLTLTPPVPQAVGTSRMLRAHWS